MKLLLHFSSIILITLLFANCSNAQEKKMENKYYSKTDTSKLAIPNEEWKKSLDAETYNIARAKGMYRCKACGNALFRSDGKFESSCGWPSFFEPINPKSVKYAEDNTHGMQRLEVMCGRCDAHLGHIFDDGPAPTYKRYCINSVILDFEKK